jgi:hypothetical protein
VLRNFNLDKLGCVKEKNLALQVVFVVLFWWTQVKVVRISTLKSHGKLRENFRIVATLLLRDDFLVAVVVATHEGFYLHAGHW